MMRLEIEDILPMLGLIGWARLIIDGSMRENYGQNSIVVLVMMRRHVNHKARKGGWKLNSAATKVDRSSFTWLK